jgi:hypothetical protein
LYSRIARLGGLLAVALLAVAGAGSASAAVTKTQVTSPVGPYFTYYDSHSSDPQEFTVSGTSDGTAGDFVDFRCFYDGSSYEELASNVAVKADGTFSAAADTTYDRTCVLRAVPDTGYSSSQLARFAGPVVGFGYYWRSENASDPAGTSVYDFNIDTATRKALHYTYSIGDCGLCGSYLYDAGFYDWNAPWDAVAAMYAYDEVEQRSQIQVDGHNAYTPAAAYYTNSTADGLPRLSLAKSFNGSTGEWTIKVTEPLAFCADGSGNVNDVVGDSASDSDCPKFVPAGVSIVRTITDSEEGLVVTIADRWTSTDGAAHGIKALYDNQFDDYTFQFPGESAMTHHETGAVVELGGSAVGTIYTQTDYSYQPGPDNVQGAMTYLTAPTRAVFSDDDEFTLEYGRTIPAGGSVDITHVFSAAFSREQVRAFAGAVEDRNAAPAVAITSPAAGAVVSRDSVAVVGTASDNVGVSSLTVNGLPTRVQADGSWSQRVDLVPGANTITAIAKDGSGNASQAQVSVTYSPPAAPACVAPGLLGQAETAATAAVTAAGCTVGTITRVASAKAKGTVLSQSRAGGAKLPAYFPIDLKVSAGKVGKPSLAAKSARVKKGRVKLSVRCSADSAGCKGTVKLRAKVGGKVRTLGSAAVNAAAGDARAVTVRLSKSGARLVQGRTVKAEVVFSYRDEAGKAKTTKGKLTVKG